MSDNPKKEEEKQLIGIEFNDFGNQNHSSNENVIRRRSNNKKNITKSN